MKHGLRISLKSVKIQWSEGEIEMVDTESEGEIDSVNFHVDFHAEKGSLSQLSEGYIKWSKRIMPNGNCSIN